MRYRPNWPLTCGRGASFVCPSRAVPCGAGYWPFPLSPRTGLSCGRWPRLWVGGPSRACATWPAGPHGAGPGAAALCWSPLRPSPPSGSCLQGGTGPCMVLRRSGPPAPGRGPAANPGSASSAGPVGERGSGEARQLVQDAWRAGTHVLRLPPVYSATDLVEAAAEHGPVLVVAPTNGRASAGCAALRRRGATVALLPGDWALARAGTDVVIGARAAAGPVPRARLDRRARRPRRRPRAGAGADMGRARRSP